MPEGPTTSRIARTTRLGGLVAGQSAKFAGGRMLDRARSVDARERAQQKRTAEIVEQIVVQLGRMKGAAMKLGQVLSTAELPGLDPEASERINTRLAELRDSAPQVPFKKLEKLMAREWGQPVGSVLADLEPEAMAAASIGQVHRGRTRDGRDVAIKVQYPGIAEAVDADLRNLRLLMPLLARLAPGLDARALADELRERISEELDYELEATAQRRLARLWRDHPHVLVPAVDTELSTRRVLVTELAEGLRFGELKARPDSDRDRTAEIVHRFYYDTADDFGIALGDPHPGNWQLLPDGRVAIFDHAMQRALPPHYLKREGPLIEAVRAQDADRAFEVMLELGYLGDGSAFADRGLLLDHLTLISYWVVAEEQPVRLSPEIQRAMGEDLLALGPEWRRMVRSFSLPTEALLLRRMGDLLFTGFCQLRAAADWWGLSCEIQLGHGPATPLGREHAEWMRARGA